MAPKEEEEVLAGFFHRRSMKLASGRRAAPVAKVEMMEEAIPPPLPPRVLSVHPSTVAAAPMKRDAGPSSFYKMEPQSFFQPLPMSEAAHPLPLAGLSLGSVTGAAPPPPPPPAGPRPFQSMEASYYASPQRCVSSSPLVSAKDFTWAV